MRLASRRNFIPGFVGDVTFCAPGRAGRPGSGDASGSALSESRMAEGVRFFPLSATFRIIP